MPLGQINPLNFVVARQLASNQNVDASTATRHALVGTLLGEGILGPIIARQLAIRDAAPAAPAPIVTGTAPPGTPLDKIAENLQAWTAAESKRDGEDIRRANELLEQAKQRQAKRTEALKALCDSLGGLSGGATETAGEGANSGARKRPG